MIYSVTGTLAHQEPGLAVVECAGVGYACRTTLSTLAQLGGIGEQARLYTYLQVREDGVELFGFASQQELNCFKMLISVSGVGPKAALAILSDATPERFALSVAAGDSKALTRTKGVGAKIAQRIVLELKDKISKDQSGGGLEPSEPLPDLGMGGVGEAVSALVVLGYNQTDAARVVAGLDASLPVSELVRMALVHIGKSKR